MINYIMWSSKKKKKKVLLFKKIVQYANVQKKCIRQLTTELC